MLLAACLAAVALATPPDSTASARTLARLVAEHEARRALDPVARAREGARVEHLPDLSTARVDADAARARTVVGALDLLAPKELTSEEWFTSRVLRWELVQDIEAARYRGLSFAMLTPYSTPLRNVPAILAAQPLATRADADHYVALVAEVATMADTIRGALESRRAAGVLLPQPEVDLVVPFLRGYAQPAERGPFTPAAERLGALAPADREAIGKSLGAVIAGRVNPALERLATWLAGPYRAAAPAGVGLGQYPGGAAYYRALVRRHTTLDVTPEEVHRIGLAEVARLDSAMAAVRAELGFTGTREAFHAQLAKDPRFFARVPAEFGEKLAYHDARMRLRVGELFARQPRAVGDVQRLDPRLEGSMTFGYYQVPTARDSMGHYFYNGSDLEQRSLLSAASIVFHELVPGHHFQFNLQRESTTLPRFRREADYTAFVEGWGEYAAALAGELGLYSDPYDRYGRLAMDSFFACRLVVDTGMNALGWTREQAAAFMLAHTMQGEAQVATEMLRYSADLPGQALAYKMGSRELLRMREEARRRLGDRFDIKRWHAFVLDGGAMPFTILRQRLEAWIAAGGNAP